MAMPKVTRRDDWTLVYDLSEASGKDANGNLYPPPDLSAVHLFFTLKRRDCDPDAKALVEYDFEVPPDDNARGGVAIIIIPHSLTDVPAGIHRFDVQQILPGSAALTATPFNGLMRVIQDVTQRRASPP